MREYKEAILGVRMKNYDVATIAADSLLRQFIAFTEGSYFLYLIKPGGLTALWYPRAGEWVRDTPYEQEICSEYLEEK